MAFSRRMYCFCSGRQFTGIRMRGILCRRLVDRRMSVWIHPAHHPLICTLLHIQSVRGRPVSKTVRGCRVKTRYIRPMTSSAQSSRRLSSSAWYPPSFCRHRGLYNQSCCAIAGLWSFLGLSAPGRIVAMACGSVCNAARSPVGTPGSGVLVGRADEGRECLGVLFSSFERVESSIGRYCLRKDKAKVGNKFKLYRHRPALSYVAIILVKLSACPHSAKSKPERATKFPHLPANIEASHKIAKVYSRHLPSSNPTQCNS